MKNFLLLIQSDSTNQMGGGLMDFLPILLIIFVFYFFMIRPQINKQKQEENFRGEIKKGDKIVTIGGIHGKVNTIKETKIILEIADNIRITIDKQSISKEKSIHNLKK